MEPLTFENIMILNVQMLGDDVFVDVYGSAEMVIGTLTYTVEDTKRRATLTKTLMRWAHEDRPLTYIRTPEGIGRLVSEDAVDRDEAGI